jgi:branched-chain amino acid transport system permease protein
VLFVQELFNGVTLGAIYATVAMSFSVIFSVTKTFHFAHGAVYMWVAYVVAFLQSTALGFAGALVVGLAVALILTLGIELLIYRPLRRRGAQGLQIFVASLGCLIVLENLVPIVFGTHNFALNIPGLDGSVTVAGITVTSIGIVQVITAIVALLVLTFIMRRTHLGRSFRAVASNREMSTLVGLDYRRRYLIAFAIGAIVVVPAAVLNSATSSVGLDMGDNIILITLIAVIVGGVESIPGAALGGLLIGVTQSIAAVFVSSQWQAAVAFGVCLVFIIFRPSGILGRTVLRSGAQ